MRIDELKRIAEENDYKIERIIDYEEIAFVRQVSSLRFITNFITIGLKREVGIFIKNTHCDEKDINMIKAAMEFRETPPEDREEEKFYLRHKWFNSMDLEYYYLNLDRDNENYYYLDSMYGDSSYQTEFTLKEIEEIKEKFDTDLADFEIVEVEDEN